MIPFEQENLEAYSLLLRIETVLRECLREGLQRDLGPNWQTRLPGDLLKEIRKAQTEEGKPQFDFVRLGPLYYLTFAHLLTVLQQRPALSVVNRLGGGTFLKQLENLFAPRNAICHGRPASHVGLMAVKALYAQVETALTTEGLRRLLATPDTGLRQSDFARAVLPFLEQTLRDLPRLPPGFTLPETYELAITQYWWADDALAGLKRNRIDDCIALLREYSALPGGVGSVGSRQAFVDRHDLKRYIEAAILEIEGMEQ